MTTVLRFITAGSVDDGKSTLIGRMLFDTKSIFEDQLEAIHILSAKRGFNNFDLSLLTDGLKAEREQGITIDVAYRYFETSRRKFIVADTPGHAQYTRNMVTGASTAELVLILIDARKGLVEQTHRHSYIASILKIKNVIICINKMDLVNYDQLVFERIVTEYKDFSLRLDIDNIQFVPISALGGDNVVHRSENMNWYQGSTLLNILETVQCKSHSYSDSARFPVQYVLRYKLNEYLGFRGLAGQIVSGVFKIGDEVITFPSELKSKVKSIFSGSEEIEEAFAPMSVQLILENEIEIGRGDIIIKLHENITAKKEIELMICWMSQKPAKLGSRFLIRHTTREVKGILIGIRHTLDINTLSINNDPDQLIINDIGRVSIRLAYQIFFDSYEKNHTMGSLILIDEDTCETVGAGMII
jgi:sulfate adenylyltransferase subunit 1